MRAARSVFKEIIMWRGVLAAFSLALIAGSGTAFAQGVTVLGTVADESKGILPGVTVTATAIDTGRQFTDVTSERGEYRLVGMLAGSYQLTAELSGFAATRIDRIDLLVLRRRG